MCMVCEETTDSKPVATAAARPPRPVALPVNPANIAPELKARRQFVVWRYTWNEQKQKWDKPPLQISGKAARVNCPGDWVSFQTAYFYYRMKVSTASGTFPRNRTGLSFSISTAWRIPMERLQRGPLSCDPSLPVTFPSRR